MTRFFAVLVATLALLSPASAQSPTKLGVPTANGGTAVVGTQTGNVSLPVTVTGSISTSSAAHATAAAPAYVEGSDDPFSQTLTGNLRVTGVGGSFPVTGTFWQATQPVSGTFWQATQPVSNAGTFAVQSAATLQAGSAIVGKFGIDQTTPGTTNGVQVNAALPAGSNVIGHVIADTGSTTAVTQTTSPWVVNVSQFGGSNVATGTGAGGTGVPRVTVSSDSTVGLVAGTALVGKVGIDQTTPGTTNGVQVNAALPAGTALIGKVGLDQTTPGTTNLVSATFSQQVASTPTVQNAAYASGNCIGGFNAVTVSANNGQTGFVTNFRVLSAGGSTPTVTVYLFDSNPSGSTCTDKSTFTLATADLDKLISAPTAIILAVPTGATASVASLDFTPPRPFIAGGSTGSGVKTIYYALVSGSTFTPATTSDIHTRVGAVLN